MSTKTKTRAVKAITVEFKVNRTLTKMFATDKITITPAIQQIVDNTIYNTKNFIELQGSDYKKKKKAENILFNHITDIEAQDEDATLPYFNDKYTGERQYYLKAKHTMEVADAQFNTERADVQDNRTTVQEIVDDQTGEVRLDTEQPTDLSKLARLQNKANTTRNMHNRAKAQYIVSRAMQATLEQLFYDYSGKRTIETDAMGKVIATHEVEVRTPYVHPPLAKEYDRIEKLLSGKDKKTVTAVSLEDIAKAYKESQADIL